MREIKFRAWQPHSSLHRKPGMYQVTGIEYYNKPDENGWGEVFLGESSEYVNDIKLMQYTGLKDKNGAEIYEHDKLLFKGQEVFCFYDDTRAIFSWAMIDELSLWQKGHSPVGVFSIYELSRENNDELEVIGNLYES